MRQDRQDTLITVAHCTQIFFVKQLKPYMFALFAVVKIKHV